MAGTKVHRSSPKLSFTPMKTLFRLVLLGGLLALTSFPARAEDGLKSAGESKAPATPIPVKPSLRKPGFCFAEFATTRPEEYLAFFESVADFHAVRHDSGYIEVESDRGQLTFLDPKFWAHGHPFSGKITGTGQGLGIEFGIVVADLDKAFAAAQQFKDKGFPISTGIVLRPWGSRDFRVLASEGYYFRVTEGH